MKLKYKIYIVAIVVIAIALGLYFANKNFKSKKISQIDVKINTQGGAELITEEDVKAIILKDFDSISNKTVKDVDLKGIENSIEKNIYVQDADAYISLDAALNVYVLQSKPIARVFNSHGESFFINTSGRLMPVGSVATEGLVVASGNINEKYKPETKLLKLDSVSYEECNNVSTLNKIFLIAEAISNDSLLNKIITQIYVNSNKSYELIPIIGSQNILLGDVDELKQKLSNLKIFYKEGYKKFYFEKYKTIDVRFTNQVVCIKKTQ